MQKHYENLFLAFTGALLELDGKSADVLESFGSSMAICQAYLRDLKVLFAAHAPQSDSDEVAFFKSVKPRFYAERMYRFERYQLWVQRPVGTVSMVRNYLEGELLVLNRFFEGYRFEYLYYKSRASEFDGVYFVRGAGKHGIMGLEVDADPEYATGMDYVFAKFMALERLREEILAELTALAPPLPSAGVGLIAGGVADVGEQVNFGGATVVKKRFDWTGEVINLVELGYAIWLTGQLNDGKAGMQDIFRWLEESFGVEIGIPANRFREIRRRKRLSRTHFMEFCQSRLIEYMDEDDVFRPGGKPNKRKALGLG
ncbi:RteC domain-containing protein [Pedobacter aquatilis]|uniref:RteC domain-containing protein n=1 Tax=Pedobacter aquatilis TaxID=351343 RepID=UPI00292E4EF9|nr:RteC domain-containing protein [Pedobacter aquatilis]